MQNTNSQQFHIKLSHFNQQRMMPDYVDENWAQKIKQELADGTFSLENYQISQQHWQLMEYMNLEFFYIATGFELHFKSWLLQNDFIVNIVEKAEPFKNLRFNT